MTPCRESSAGGTTYAHSDDSSIHRLARLLVFASIFVLPAASQISDSGSQASSDTLAWMSFRDLSNVQILSVSQRLEAVQKVPAAVQVITAIDIRRTGAESMTEALRFVPGVEVARMNSNRSAIAIRGFNSEFANKLLVLVDGRSVYTPQFAGVFWDMQDMLTEDIDRIEVVRGPGGTAWGSNAFLGVINIVNRHASRTQGLLASATTGSIDPGSVAVRYGGLASDSVWYSVYAKTSFLGNTQRSDGTEWDDHWNSSIAGFRIENAPSAQSQWSILGGADYARPIQFSGGKPSRFQALGTHLLGRWQVTPDPETRSSVQVYYDGVRRHMVQNSVNTDILDLDVQYDFVLFPSHHIRTGLSGRFIHSMPSNSSTHRFDPGTQNVYSFAAVVEDVMDVVPEEMKLTIGSKIEYHSLADWYALPSIRLSWEPIPDYLFWANISTGMRSPTTDDEYLYINTPYLISMPNNRLKTEKVISIQAGGRTILGNQLTLDLCVSHDRLTDLATRERIGGTDLQPVTQMSNMMSGTLDGIEITFGWQMLSWWRWGGTYGSEQLSLSLLEGSTDQSATFAAQRIPRHQASLRWMMQVSRSIDADVIWRYVDAMPAIRILPYRALDARVSYRAYGWLELSIVGRNLLDPRHQEFSRSPGFPGISEIPSSVYGKIVITPP